MKRSISIITVGAALAATLLATAPASFAQKGPGRMPAQTTVVHLDVIDPFDVGDALDAPDAPDAPGEGLISGKGL